MSANTAARQPKTRLLVATLAALAAAAGQAADPKLPPFAPKLQLKIQGHTSSVMGIALSPDGKYLASASRDKTVRVWNAKTGERLQRIAHQEEAYCVAFSPDGKRIAVGSRGGAINLYDRESGDKVQGIKFERSVALLRWSPDGKRLAAVGVEAREVALIDLSTGKVAVTLTGHEDAINNLAYSPDGDRLATVGEDSTIRLWEPGTGKEVDSLKAHDGAVRGVAFSADGKTLLTAGKDNTVVRWDVKTGNMRKPVLELPADKEGGLGVVAELPNGNLWVAGNGNAHAVFDGQTGKVLARKASSPSGVFSIGKLYLQNFYALSPDGKTIIQVGDNDIYVLNATAAFGLKVED